MLQKEVEFIFLIKVPQRLKRLCGKETTSGKKREMNENETF